MCVCVFATHKDECIWVWRWIPVFSFHCGVRGSQASGSQNKCFDLPSCLTSHIYVVLKTNGPWKRNLQRGVNVPSISGAQQAKLAFQCLNILIVFLLVSRLCLQEHVLRSCPSLQVTVFLTWASSLLWGARCLTNYRKVTSLQMAWYLFLDTQKQPPFWLLNS